MKRAVITMFCLGFFATKNLKAQFISDNALKIETESNYSIGKSLSPAISAPGYKDLAKKKFMVKMLSSLALATISVTSAHLYQENKNPAYLVTGITSAGLSIPLALSARKNLKGKELQLSHTNF